MNFHDYETLLEQRADAYQRMSALNGAAQAGRRDLTPTEASEYDQIEAEYDRLTRQIEGSNPTRSGHPNPSREERSGRRPGGSSSEGNLSPDQEVALRAVEAHSDTLDAASGDRLDSVVRQDRLGVEARYVAAVSSPAYKRAFAKKLTGVDGAEGFLAADEAEAMRAVGEAMSQRALAVGEGGTGGYAIPLDLDPTINLTNDGAINPIRELASVTTITHSKWEGVNSAGVEFEFQAEATESKDKSPTLTQPEITPTKAQAFVPYSIELEGDWPAVYSELVRLFADAKMIKEAEVFATGKGTENVPQGLITGATKLVETGTKEVVKVADIYSLQEALGPRWQPRATWLGANAVANQIHKFVAKGDTEDAPLMSDDRSSILGKPFREVSTMSSKTTTKLEKVLAYGDVGSAYKIVDRIGMTAEVVPHVFGENNRPTGQRGLYVYFRVGAKVINPNAVQVLKVKE